MDLFTNEVDELRATLESTEAKLYQLKEQKDREISELEFKVVRIKDDTGRYWQQKLTEMEASSNEKIKLLTLELEKLRNAYQGDSSGWEEIITPGGLIKYENKITGVITYDEPEVLFIAKIMRKADQVDQFIQESKDMKAKCKEMELKKREAELSVNKLRTEVNFLRKSDKSWKDTAKIIAGNLLMVKNMFDTQCDQVLNGLDIVSKVDRRIHKQLPLFTIVKKTVTQLQQKCDHQEAAIVSCNASLRTLKIELVEKEKRIEQLSYGIGDELERLTKPLRDRLAETMTALMKEKANRAEERRELADMWPNNHLLPVILMKSRTISSEERERRLELAKENDMKLAISLEIRANMAESKLWDLKYDDYGRPYYEHLKTGEVQWDEPEIRKYCPPDGYDTSGNIVESYYDIMKKWRTLSTSRGEIYFQHIETGEVSLSPPYSYRKLPKGKSHEQLVGEAAQLVISYIKNKISSHIHSLKSLQQEDSNLMSPDERRAKEKEDRIKARLGLNSDSTTNQTTKSIQSSNIGGNGFSSGSGVGDNTTMMMSPREEIKEDLSVYQYDIETVEMLTWKLDESMRRSKGIQLETLKKEKREFLSQSDNRKYGTDVYIGPTLYETDTKLLSLQQIRSIVEYFADMESKLDSKLSKTRENLKDFSTVLMEKLKEVEEHATKEASLNKSSDMMTSSESKEIYDSSSKSRQIKRDRDDNISESSLTKSGKSTSDNMNILERDRKKYKSSKDTTSIKEQRILQVSIQSMEEVENPHHRNDDGDDDVMDHEDFHNHVLEECYVKTYGDLLYESTNFKDTNETNFISPEIYQSCSHLVNFSLYCGYSNTDIDRLPDSLFTTNQVTESINHIKQTKNDTKGSTMKTDDEWLTASYFLSVNKVNVDMIRKMTFYSYDTVHGLLPKYPIHSNSFIKMASQRNDNQNDSMNNDSNTSINNISNNIYSSQNEEFMSQPMFSTMDSASLINTFGERGANKVTNIPQYTINQPWTHSTTEYHSSFTINHEVWKSRQFMADILRYQLQQRAIQHVIDYGINSSYNNSNNDNNNSNNNTIPILESKSNHLIKTSDRDRYVILSIHHITLTDMLWNQWLDEELFYIQFSLGNWKARTSKRSQLSGSLCIEWLSMSNQSKDECKDPLKAVIALQVPLSRLESEYILVEVYTCRQYSADILVGCSSLSIQSAIKQFSSTVSIPIQLMERSNQNRVCGNIHVSVSITNIPISKPIESDPNQLLILKEKKPSKPLDPTIIKIRADKEKDKLFGDYSMLPKEKLSFASLFNDHYSTDGQLLKLLSADITADEILHKGYRLSNDNNSNSNSSSSSKSHHSSTIPSIESNQGHLSSMKPLPNFIKATNFLKQKAKIHHVQVENHSSKVETLYPTVENSFQTKMNVASKRYNESKKRLKTYQDNLVKIQTEIKRIEGRIQSSKFDLSRPKDIVIDEILSIPYVPLIPNMATSREDRTRPLLTASEITDLIQSIGQGDMDGKDWFTIFATHRANPKQVKLLSNEIQSRNEYLELKRQHDLQEQQRLIDNYTEEMAYFEKEEKRRKLELSKLKKDLRKVYLKHDICMESINQINEEHSALELDMTTLEGIIELHRKSMDRYKVIRMKQILEKERHCKSIISLKKRLLQLMNNRRQVLNLPLSVLSSTSSSSTSTESTESTPKNMMEEEYAILCSKAEDVLRSLEYELIDIKESLVSEGVKLRHIHREEQSTCQYEYNRLIFLQDLIEQRSCIDKILERNQYEILHLYESKEKILMIEADKDDAGKDTIDGNGERYAMDKTWDSNELNACCRLIDLIKNKIGLINSISRTAASCQKNLFESISIKWTEDYLQLRDSWCENSDYVRSQNLLYDIVKWTSEQRMKLSSLENQISSERLELEVNVNALNEQMKEQQMIHSIEIESITSSATSTIKSFQSKLEILQKESFHKQGLLEESITELSRECQKTREQLTSQALIYENKNKILWAMVTTQQDAVQNLTAKLETIIDEREKIVIKAKLDFDRLRTQIRNERKYSANLLFIIQAQRGAIQYYRNHTDHIIETSRKRERKLEVDKQSLRSEIFNYMYAFTRLATDPDELFEFFTARLANLCGSKKRTNDILAQHNNAVMVLAALCRSPRPLIRKYASRALGSIGWNGFVEDRVLVWDAMMYWKIFVSKILSSAESSMEYQTSKQSYRIHGHNDAILDAQKNMTSEEYAGEQDGLTRDEKFSLATGLSPTNASVRTIIKHRRQYALRAVRRIEGPNTLNQRLINIKDGVIPSLIELCNQEGEKDWEIPRNAALAICIASYEPKNHHDMSHNQSCVDLLVQLCQHEDSEVQIHAAITIANLCHNDENAQYIFGHMAQTIPILLSMCSNSMVVDVLEASTAALANMTCYSDGNCKLVMESDGIPILIQLIKNCYTENLLDMDQNEEIQANAAETLANVSRYYTEESIGYFDNDVMDSLVFMCASRNLQVKRHAPLVIGNISQSERCREELGKRGVIESLFLALEDIPIELPTHGRKETTWEHDPTVQANTLWALCNLMWHPPNQERAGRFIHEILALLSTSELGVVVGEPSTSSVETATVTATATVAIKQQPSPPHHPIQIYAHTLLANILYYNNSNRVRFLECEGALETLLSTITNKFTDLIILENSLRSLLSLSYLDSVSTWLVKTNHYMNLFLKFLSPPYVSKHVVRFSLGIISNLSISYENRKILFELGGLDILINLSLDDDKHIITLSQDVVERLEDVTSPEDMTKKKESIGLKNMITLASHSDPLVRATAAESIGEEIWLDRNKQKEANENGGMNALLLILKSPEERYESILPSLWSLRNLLHNNTESQHQFFMKDGISSVCAILQHSVKTVYEDQVDKVLEACLACIATSIINHTGNSRRLLVVGLPILLDIVDEKVKDSIIGINEEYIQLTKLAFSSNTVIALAKSILLMLGPYNYVICRNCTKKQELSGTNCVSCGHRLRVDVVEKVSISKSDRRKYESSPQSQSQYQKKELLPLVALRFSATTTTTTATTTSIVEDKKEIKSRKSMKLPLSSTLSSSLPVSSSSSGSSQKNRTMPPLQGIVGEKTSIS